jgi:type I thyroxine 5'-deiodinase
VKKGFGKSVERSLVAGACVRKLGIKFPALIDGFENLTEKAYTGWPDRIYLIDTRGRVAYKSRPGPFGFKPQELRSALEHLPEAKGGNQPGIEDHLASLNGTGIQP